MSEFDKKISALTSGTDSTATDEYVIARGGSNFKISGALVAAGATKVGTLASLAVTGNVSLGADVVLSRGAADRLDLASGDSLNIVSGTVKIAGTDVLGATTLGSGVTASSLTSVGTLASLAVTGDLTVDTDTLKVDAANNRVGIGTASPEAQLVVSKATSAGEGGYIYIDNPVASATGNKAGIKFATSSGGSFATFPTGEITNVLTNSGDGASALTFGTFDGSASAERARITAGGYFKASNAGTYENAAGTYHELRSSTSGSASVRISHSDTGAGAYGAYIRFTGSSPDNNTNWFLACDDTTAVRLYVYSDGDLANHDGVYGTISDERLKQDIVDAGSAWDDLKAVRFRKYRMKTDVEANPDAHAMLGVVAQELEQVMPGLVDEHPDMAQVQVPVLDEDGNETGEFTTEQRPTGTSTKTVKSSILLMKAAVALQEAMARIESLEARLDALEN
jgi:hypothetical protein